jgi:hypothetical protein
MSPIFTLLSSGKYHVYVIFVHLFPIISLPITGMFAYVRNQTHCKSHHSNVLCLAQYWVCHNFSIDHYVMKCNWHHVNGTSKGTSYCFRHIACVFVLFSVCGNKHYTSYQNHKHPSKIIWKRFLVGVPIMSFLMVYI